MKRSPRAGGSGNRLTPQGETLPQPAGGSAPPPDDRPSQRSDDRPSESGPDAPRTLGVKRSTEPREGGPTRPGVRARFLSASERRLAAQTARDRGATGEGPERPQRSPAAQRRARDDAAGGAASAPERSEVGDPRRRRGSADAEREGRPRPDRPAHKTSSARPVGAGADSGRARGNEGYRASPPGRDSDRDGREKSARERFGRSGADTGSDPKRGRADAPARRRDDMPRAGAGTPHRRDERDAPKPGARPPRAGAESAPVSELSRPRREQGSEASQRPRKQDSEASRRPRDLPRASGSVPGERAPGALEPGGGRARSEHSTRPTAGDGEPPVGIRLSKVMAERGLCSRREADEIIERGWVFVDGRRVSELGVRIDPDAEIALAPQAKRRQAEQVTILLHKPVGYVSGQPEPGFEPAVSLIGPDNQYDRGAAQRFHASHLKGLAPAGRLDIDSTGLLVLTQNGRVARQLIGDDSKIDKEYLVRVEGRLDERGLALLNHGLELDGHRLRPAKVEWLNEDQLRFVLREGRKRQIRRMCELVGLKVVGLKRVRIGRVKLGDLPLGQWRFLREDERF